jgi:hypothetical protein
MEGCSYFFKISIFLAFVLCFETRFNISNTKGFAGRSVFVDGDFFFVAVIVINYNELL